MKREYRKRAAKRKSLEALKTQVWNENTTETAVETSEATSVVGSKSSETSINENEVTDKGAAPENSDAQNEIKTAGKVHEDTIETGKGNTDTNESNTSETAVVLKDENLQERVNDTLENGTKVPQTASLNSENQAEDFQRHPAENSSTKDSAASFIEQQALASAANEAAVRFYSSLNLLATRAFFNVKQEPMDLPLADKLMSSFNTAGYFGATPDALMGRDLRSLGGDSNFLSAAYRSPLGMARPPAELSPDTFADQLRHNDSASMVVCRPHTGKTMQNPFHASLESPPGNSGRSNTLQQNHQSSTSLHHFVTRYTIEKPDDPSRLGVEICLEHSTTNEPVIEVECGGNKGMLYVTKLCQGSKGQSILFNDEWLTPNEFQFISGRETAKDWKRSIRHCGKSLKTLMSKGILQVHPPVCECDYCKGHGPAVVEKPGKKRPVGSGSADIVRRNSMSENTAASTGSSTPSSTDSNKVFGMPDTHGPTTIHKGREGGLNSIISQLHNKKAICGNDVTAGTESLDLSVRCSSSTSPNGDCERKRQHRPSNSQSESPPMKRRHSDDDDAFPVPNGRDNEHNVRDKDRESSSAEPLCLASHGSSKKEKTHSNKTSKKENDVIFDPRRIGSNDHNKSPNGRNHYPDFNDCASNGYRPNLGFAEYALFDAMKRAVASVSGGSYPDSVSTPPPNRRDVSSPNRGYINLDSTSPRGLTSQNYPQSRNQQPMMELVSPHRKNGTSRESYGFGNSVDSRLRNGGLFDAPLPSNKAPVTVLHHRPNSYSPHRSNPSHTHHYYGMPPPSSSRHSPDGRGARTPRREVPFSAPARFDRKTNTPIKKTPDHQRSRLHGRSDARGTKMLDLQNHAIPMMSLTYSNKKASRGRQSDSSPPQFSTGSATSNAGKCVYSDDEVARTSDLNRRLSSSAPPISLPSSKSRKFYTDENNNRSSDDQPSSRQYVFGGGKRAKSSSPGSPSDAPFFCDDRRSQDPVDPCGFSCGAACQNSFQELRLRELSCAIDQMAELSVDGVCEMLEEIGCGEYQEVFRKNCISGDALPLLAEHHLVEMMGLKLGHALKIIAQIHRRLGNHCFLMTNQLPAFRHASPIDYLCLRKQAATPNGQSDNITTPARVAKEAEIKKVAENEKVPENTTAE
uniref:uncharacterized protein LOC100176298 isoform X2 n=1 Tax=Ciona intestinalis TaxID=7719 RepID=UPI00089DAA58|nr:uncharacterized protein LOC100176298 isoform X2 [Ciona intestinalis]|eukprot:XP_018669979.1 uncharacterized protein LOC100176298 isoform X2 [Ciona intestinalis]